MEEVAAESTQSTTKQGTHNVITHYYKQWITPGTNIDIYCVLG